MTISPTHTSDSPMNRVAMMTEDPISPFDKDSLCCDSSLTSSRNFQGFPVASAVTSALSEDFPCVDFENNNNAPTITAESASTVFRSQQQQQQQHFPPIRQPHPPPMLRRPTAPPLSNNFTPILPQQPVATRSNFTPFRPRISTPIQPPLFPSQANIPPVFNSQHLKPAHADPPPSLPPPLQGQIDPSTVDLMDDSMDW